MVIFEFIFTSDCGDEKTVRRVSCFSGFPLLARKKDKTSGVDDLVLLSSRCVEPCSGETDQTESVWKKTGRKINIRTKVLSHNSGKLDPLRLGERVHLEDFLFISV